MLTQELFRQFHSRKLHLHSSVVEPPVAVTSTAPSTSPSERVYNSFDANVVMVLSVLLCALICSLGVNSIIRCALRCSSFVSSNESLNQNPSARLPNTGITKKALKTFLTIGYSSELKLPGLDTECAICLSEFATGEKVRVLPNCSHGFHVRCIDKWLNSHSSCPTCRHCLIETCQKFVRCSSQNQQQASASVMPPAAQESIVGIAPLEPEGFVRNHELNYLSPILN